MDWINHERDRLFDETTPIMGDPVKFRASEAHHYATGVVIGATVVARRFDVRGDDGIVYNNLSDVKIDHERLGK